MIIISLVWDRLKVSVHFFSPKVMPSGRSKLSDKGVQFPVASQAVQQHHHVQDRTLILGCGREARTTVFLLIIYNLSHVAADGTGSRNSEMETSN